MEMLASPPISLVSVPGHGSRKPPFAVSLVKACRPHQWAKNLLVFVPLALSHRFTEWAVINEFLHAFLAFGLAASGVYVLNDLLDAESDRAHPVKRRRPLASGALSPRAGLLLSTGLLLGALGLAGAFLPIQFLAVLGAYLLTTLFYSLYAKRLLFIDVLCLAGLYTVRIVAGSTISEVFLSEWLIAFSIFFFLSLALVKRYTELIQTIEEEGKKIRGRDYRLSDVEILRGLGVNCGVVSVLVFALYVASGDFSKLYHRQHFLWLICPLLLYWISRVWFLAGRNAMPHDPVLFALRDRNSYLAGALVVLLLFAAR